MCVAGLCDRPFVLCSYSGRSLVVVVRALGDGDVGKLAYRLWPQQAGVYLRAAYALTEPGTPELASRSLTGVGDGWREMFTWARTQVARTCMLEQPRLQLGETWLSFSLPLSQAASSRSQSIDLDCSPTLDPSIDLPSPHSQCSTSGDSSCRRCCSWA